MSYFRNFKKLKEKAKEVTIADLYPWELKTTGNLLRGFCPFHQDTKTPNFYVYPETNTWYCFAGCGGGDSIDFYKKLKTTSFNKAVRRLANDF